MVKVNGMVDISTKDITVRTAKASGTIFVDDEAQKMVASRRPEISSLIKCLDKELEWNF
ncbi:MAG: cyclic pyranopterin monophosphate synthase MoaC [Planctomycetes bacterium]|nr:cyclic pyranopterin monophosphate synthase MoaC [Planctomycetota bacterium]